MASEKAKRGLGIPLGKNGAIIRGELVTFDDGSAKWTYEKDLNPLVSGFGDRSTFTSTKDVNGKWGWTPTTSTSVQNLSNRTGLTPKQIDDGLYKTPAVQTVLNGQRINLLGGIQESVKIDTNLPGTTGVETRLTTPVDQSGAEQSAAFEEEVKKESREGTRKEYGDVKYPVGLDPKVQDCIKFSIFEYKAPGVQPGNSAAGSRIVSIINKNPGFGNERDKKILGTITLPIPGGINDSNTVNWQGNSLDELMRAGANVAIGGITEGGSGIVASAKQEYQKAMGNSGLGQAITAFFAEQATGASNLLSRQFGAVVNPNLELLFNGPELRNFGFNFRMSPRSAPEAKNIRKIIRFFKQAMSVKRSNSSLLLKAPHTFAISYVTSNVQHPYLNRFKECALTSCNVNYTPDGTYMTYAGETPNDRSMTAYELSLTFQEIEPLFDDDYGSEKEITSIGF